MITFEAKDRAAVLQALRPQRTAIATIFAESTTLLPRWKDELPTDATERASFVDREFSALADYLSQYFKTGDTSFIWLFVGERLKAIHDPSLPTEQRMALVAEICATERSALTQQMGGQWPAHALAAVQAVLAQIHESLQQRAPITKKVLVVGDCLFLDIVAFLSGTLQAAGISLDVEYVASKSVSDLVKQIRRLGDQKFDLAFFSPFSYDLFLEQAQLLSWRHALDGAAKVETTSLALSQKVDQVLTALADTFECPIVVHNFSGLLRDEHAITRWFKRTVTRHNRARAQRLCNQLLRQSMDRINGGSFKHIHLYDEAASVAAHGEQAAGAYFYKTYLQHPAVLGKILAPDYADLIHAHCVLNTKKLVVCDLDNTVWDGVIGEGAVSHFHDRQQILKKLKSKGVVLAILSKNDPANVHWRDGTLNEDDFVYASISWDPKVQGMKRIEKGLNMKMKDFIFIDDRTDERELMTSTYPQVLSLDATDPATWQRLSLWADAIDDDQSMDRTQMYRQREARIGFIGKEEGEAEANAELFMSLGLTLKVTRAQPSDLKRVAELINRTNQFNLEGSRTSFKQVSDWHASPRHLIVTGQTGDRFGDMGTTCVAVLQIDGEEAQVLPFVLSCRVFGYGIEHAVMNHLRDWAAQQGAKRVRAHYKATGQNMPCKDFLSNEGFVQQGDHWLLDLAQPAKDIAPWLTLAK